MIGSTAVSARDPLVFLLSPPRSGSTLLQHVLGSHSQFLVLPESWLLLPVVYASRKGALHGEYNGALASGALNEFLGALNAGKTAYRDAAAAFARTLYERALEEHGKAYFLEKTPRYYLIIPELAAMFPAARFVVLYRNPLATFASVLKTNLHGNLRGFTFPDRWNDIMRALPLLTDGADLLGSRALSVRYEDLVADPEPTVRRLCTHLGVEFEAGMLEYGGKVEFRGSGFVDPKSIYRHARPVRDYVDTWKQTFATAHMKRLGSGYLRALGAPLLKRAGYDLDTLSSELEAIRVQGPAWPPVVPVPWSALARPRTERSALERFGVDAVCTLSARGLRTEDVARAARRMLRG